VKKAIVSGANGFIGTALCRELSEHGTETIAIVRNENENYDSIAGLENVRIVFSDLAQFKDLDQVIPDRDADVFYHLAWIGSAGDLRGNTDIQLDNVRYACETLQMCKRIGCGRFVFASSIMEYEIMALMDTDETPGINTLYSSAKLSADFMLRTLAGHYGTDYIRAVISNIYGPGEKSPRLISTSLRKMLNHEHCSFSAGEQLYDFVYITDAVRMFRAIGEKGLTNRTYYIGSLNPRPLKEFLLEMRDQADPEAEPGLGEIPFTGVSLTYREFDVTAVKNDTGVIPEISFREGIKRTLEWMKECGE
jgi:UDP-glucose 4-epimerase